MTGRHVSRVRGRQVRSLYGISRGTTRGGRRQTEESSLKKAEIPVVRCLQSATVAVIRRSRCRERTPAFLLESSPAMSCVRRDVAASIASPEGFGTDLAIAGCFDRTLGISV